MPDTLNIDEIVQQLNEARDAFNNYCTSLADEHFFYQPAGKWSPAQQVKHLITAAKNTRLAFVLPKFIVRLYAGKPNRSSKTYDELVSKYELKLQKGGTASGPYIPKPVLNQHLR
ncbi:MAG TPA: DinB family protein [Chitinophagaceae bacterium]|nr:DinB family protein [Chitinophagaceae bacterium]